MLSSIKQIVREFLGVDLLPSYISELSARIRSTESRPVLVCVTILCRTSDCGKEGMTTLGAEAFLRPGQSITIPIYPQRLTGRFTYFVSGHPNLVMTSFKIGNSCIDSDSAGKKYGEFEGTVEVGNMIRVHVEYREPGGSLV